MIQNKSDQNCSCRITGRLSQSYAGNHRTYQNNKVMHHYFTSITAVFYPSKTTYINLKCREDTREGFRPENENPNENCNMVLYTKSTSNDDSIEYDGCTVKQINVCPNIKQ